LKLGSTAPDQFPPDQKSIFQNMYQNNPRPGNNNTNVNNTNPVNNVISNMNGKKMKGPIQTFDGKILSNIDESDENSIKKESIKDLTDVTKLAGIDIKKESSKYLIGDEETEDEMKYETEDTDPNFLILQTLKKKMFSIATVKGLKQINEDVYNYASFAVQEYLRNIIQNILKVSEQRLELHKSNILQTTPSQNTKSQLKLVEERELKRRKTSETESIATKLKSTTELTNNLGTNTTTNNIDALQETNIVNNPSEQQTPFSNVQPLFTQQNLQQLQQLQQMQQQGKPLTPQEQKYYNSLRMQLQKLHTYQQEQAKRKSKPDPEVIRHKDKSITFKDILFCDKIIDPIIIQKWDINRRKKANNLKPRTNYRSIPR
jgi:hypothetical protein